MYETFAPNDQTVNALFQLGRFGKVMQVRTDYYPAERQPCQYDSHMLLWRDVIHMSPGGVALK